MALDPNIRSIVISGGAGSGKTRLGQELGAFLINRNIISNGVYYIDLLDAHSQKDIENIFL